MTTNRLGSFALLLLAVLGIGAGVYTAYDWLWGPEAQWRAAQEAVKRHDFVQADKLVKQYLQARPDKAEAHLLAAQIARRARQPHFGDEDLDLANGSSSAAPDIGSYEEAEHQLKEYKRLGGVPELIQMERFLAHAQRGDLADVEKQLWTWVEQKHPYRLLILEALAKGYVIAYRLPEAEKCLDWVLEEEESPQILSLRAWLACRAQRFDRAVELYRRILELDAGNEEAELQLASTLRSAAKPQEALPYFEHLRQRHPADRSVTFGLAETQMALGHQEEARQLLDPWLAEDPDNPEPLLLRARIDWKDRHTASAEALVRKVLAKNIWDREANRLLSLCLGPKGNKEELHEIQSRLDNIQAEIARLDEVTIQLMTSPRDTTLRWEAGAIMICRGHAKAGVGWLQSVLAINPQHPQAGRLLAEYQRYGDKSGSQLYCGAHVVLAEYYKTLQEPKFKALVAYHDKAVRLAGPAAEAPSPSK
jgi:tetratricopeptide (TPR) repeat protein